ncbi:unnamed protein product, partial [Meganyctiphanes norvegica]
VMVVLHVSWADYTTPTIISQYTLYPSTHYPNTLVLPSDTVPSGKSDPPAVNSSYLSVTSIPSAISQVQEGNLSNGELCSSSDIGYCRLASKCLPSNLHALEACALCYAYMPLRSFYKQLRLNPVTVLHDGQNYDISHLDNGTHV